MGFWDVIEFFQIFLPPVLLTGSIIALVQAIKKKRQTKTKVLFIFAVAATGIASLQFVYFAVALIGFVFGGWEIPF